MITIDTKTARIRFLDTHKFADVDDVPENIKKGDFIVVETEKGEELVLVVGRSIPDRENPSTYKFLRKATKKDVNIFDKHEKEAEKALNLCKKLAENLGLKMNLLKAYIPLNRSKILFYYVSEGRVDFRQLVKELAKKLKMRIEMRQVGVRDGVQMAGAIGVCGNQCCCSLFIDKFDTVNVEMLEEQNLPPTPSKFTGICGRLMCCLAFEIENYSIRKDLPEIDSEVEINGEMYRVKEYDFIKEKIILVSDIGETLSFSFDELDNIGIKRKSPCEGCSMKNGGGTGIESEGA
ncbi:Cell fate regulator YaaT, PSP1 superfamily (controls sporulation, competence, biofilm development) [Persephonella hydrogeniphila]|uniref:Cell fate regulator YaaT, PSP1 superfamily (Controls sporulation, competence, biofilm development) n=1 Tax=Persephonella hydrogeniphila TaxID=198703 RepID=A0A285NAQ7_9AQUI|nr:regulatory iron-sulfur-containing complex subunit RicT [Persephonella hydrogeniphila]SNZ06574.1 Cell fate regulator YaaT, PSP1 superfamily (controls sporulation, competence, biofilm development) [Persephonella hydrogeniphila]